MIRNFKTMKSALLIFQLFIASSIFAQKQVVDLIVHNADIYTVNTRFDIAEAFAVKGDRILAIGTEEEIFSKFQSKSMLNALGKTILPGLIDAHAHFYRYGEALQTVDLVATKSWDEIVQKTEAFAKQNTEGWLVGRGWDQNDWVIKEYPTKEQLDKLFPKRPVILTRVDGHAAIVNQVALDSAKIQAGQTLTGGEIETKNGQLTGILVDNAIGLVRSLIPEANEKQRRQAFLDAQKNCFAVGLTTVVDCGLDAPLVDFIEKMNLDKSLKMRLYVMLSDGRANYEYLFKRGIIKTDRLHVRSFKLYADGALGSRGACLLHPYTDRANHFGFLLKDTAYYAAVTKKIAEHEGMQACTHAIGDSANRAILQIYGDVLKGANDRRWRIEHAQVINQADFSLFKKYSIVPSVQPTHATSDMYWAGARLGKERETGAYAYHKLMEQNGWLPLGTDFPVEDINPILTFYAAVARKDEKGFPEGGYQIDNALNREQTLRGMTIWAAKANFEEQEKGSLEVGKFADFIILNQNIMEVAPLDILKTKVLTTYVGGEKVFGQ
jgi:predicted amidohydrolase YtcJ